MKQRRCGHESIKNWAENMILWLSFVNEQHKAGKRIRLQWTGLRYGRQSNMGWILLQHLLQDGRNRPKWQWASIVVERSQLTRTRWQENWTVVAKNANPKRADRLIHTYHMGNFCSSCSCQIQSIPLCRLHAKTGLPLAGDSCLSLASLSSKNSSQTRTELS